MGYDFHLDDDGPKLIEINTNAGGAFFNALLARAQLACCAEIEGAIEAARVGDFEAEVVRMFRDEWRRQRGNTPIPRIAIVDDHPEEQYLYPEFVLARQLFLKAGLDAVFAAPTCSWEDAAATIGTTDTFTKGAVATAMLGGTKVTLVGIVKGSGMIAPDMATMLGYVFTDAAVEPAFLQKCLSSASEGTFNCITVDSDTSTSDTVLAFATGQAGNTPVASFEDAGADAFAAALNDVCRQLAHLVVRDGEGAQKFIEIAVTGAASDESARKVGLAVANSPLVKTAIAGEDANWGRVVMAVGKAGEPADRDKLSIGFGGTWAARDGQPLPDYDEVPVAKHLQGQDIVIEIDLGLGDGRATVWTCDLTHGYISINADYRS
ncbi:MAG: bifunctional glutamate N-acetyltransferase/amino-acid acetyltransferase ArgJ [Tsuneonella sp.]